MRWLVCDRVRQAVLSTKIGFKNSKVTNTAGLDFMTTSFLPVARDSQAIVWLTKGCCQIVSECRMLEQPAVHNLTLKPRTCLRIRSLMQIPNTKSYSDNSSETVRQWIYDLIPQEYCFSNRYPIVEACVSFSCVEIGCVGNTSHCICCSQNRPSTTPVSALTSML